MNFEKPWVPIEAEVCEMLVDDALNDPHHFRDFLVEHGIEMGAVRPKTTARDDDPTFRAVRSAISFMNGELGANDAIFPSALVRKGRYPLVRQMRDVHQFDVGSHLALCYVAARRAAPVRLAAAGGFQHAAAYLSTVYDETPDSALELAAIFHDLFKAFRSRRGLPSKLGPALRPTWYLPDGSTPPESVLEEEGEIAQMLLPVFCDDATLNLAQISDAIAVSSKWGSMLYRLLNYEPEAASRVARQTIDGLLKQDVGLGIYTGVVDWLGKGWALDVLTIRKERKLTLRAAGEIAFKELDALLAAS